MNICHILAMTRPQYDQGSYIVQDVYVSYVYVHILAI